MYNSNHRVGHNTLPPGAGGGVRQGNMNPMLFNPHQPGMDTMMNGYGQPQGYRAGGGVQMPGGHMPSGGANLGNRGYPGAVGQGGYPHQSAGAHQAHLSHQQKELLKEQVF